VLERKNPLGLINAFRSAFGKSADVQLVIKVSRGQANPQDLARLKAACAAAGAAVVLIDRVMSREEVFALVKCCDCYVSLHRSEGFGLTMAEAMGLGKPVIATGYSGNLDFMTPKNSYLVDYTTGAVPTGCDPYPAGSPWAEPDLDQAAALMRRVFEAPDEARAKSAQARQDILTKHNAKVAGNILNQRLDEIRQLRARVGSAASPSARTRSGNSASLAIQKERALLASLDHAETLLTPKSSAVSSRRFRGPVLFFQELLFKILRPYWWQQRQLQTLLLNTLREVAQEMSRAATSEPRQREALESVWTALHSLESLRSAVQSIESEQQGSQERLVRMKEQIEALQQAVSSLQASAATPLEALTRQLGSTTDRTTELPKRHG
jgi:hypothetical protein